MREVANSIELGSEAAAQGGAPSESDLVAQTFPVAQIGSDGVHNERRLIVHSRALGKWI